MRCAWREAKLFLTIFTNILRGNENEDSSCGPTSGCDAGKDMGVNTWAAFAGSDENAVVDGDFAVLEGELQPVLRALRRHDIDVVAIHHHMTEEKPRILFLHYWGQGKAA